MLAAAIVKIPRSVKLYQAAASLEPTSKGKRTVLRLALEAIPSSVKLWKAAVSLESVADARLKLSRAVECDPHSADVWLALARLETYENARKVLNSARKAVPSEVRIWIAAARLEEGQGEGHGKNVEMIVGKAVEALGEGGAVKRAQWLQEAEICEEAGSVLTAAAIVASAVELGVEKEDRHRTLVADAEAARGRNSVHTARAILNHCLNIFPAKKTLWLKLADLERAQGSPESLNRVLKAAVKAVPKAEVLWLMAAKETWLAGDVAGARAVLADAFAANPDSEAVWLAGVKLEWENGEVPRARALLARARERAGTDRVYMKSALLEREAGDFERTLTLLKEGAGKFPTFVKFYLIGAQVCWEDLGDVKRAREWVGRGLGRAETAVSLWVQSARIEEEGGGGGGAGKARGVLEVARLKVRGREGCDRAWLESVRLERRAGDSAAADSLLAMALQECKASGLLWSESIATSKRVERKSKSMDALKACSDDCRVVCAVAGLFVAERKYEKARKWFARAAALSPEFGDTWAVWYAFEKGPGGGGVDRMRDVAEKCVKAEPRYGDVWQRVSKSTVNRRKGVKERLLLAVEEVEREDEEG